MSCLGQTPEKSSLSLHSPDLSGHAPEILKQFPQSYSTLEASLLVPDFTIPVYGSSCHSCIRQFMPFLCTAVHVILSFSVSFSRLFFFCLYLGISSCLRDANITKRKRRSKSEAENEKVA